MILRKTTKWREITLLLIERLNIVMMFILPILVYRFHEIFFKISAGYFQDI